MTHFCPKTRKSFAPKAVHTVRIPQDRRRVHPVPSQRQGGRAVRNRLGDLEAFPTLPALRGSAWCPMRDIPNTESRATPAQGCVFGPF